MTGIYDNAGFIARIVAAADARAKQYLASTPFCDVCGFRVSTRRPRHSICEPDTLVGKVCVCPSGCTVTIYGDAGKCRPDCEVCELMSGKPYAKRR